ncbi:MAG: YbhB/YbcL family Raf kinase inhibitor-like protein [Gammaproteobacteria bacterium]
MLEKLPETLGHLLGSQRAGLENILFNTLDLRDGTAKITLTSPAFVDHAPIPPQYTADGEGLSPEIDWNGIPPSTKSLALIVEDADSPTPAPLVHAIAVDNRPEATPASGKRAAGNRSRQEQPRSRSAENSYLRQAWLPPDPPPGHGIHRYAFQLFALGDGEPFAPAPGRHELMEALRKRAIASGCPHRHLHSRPSHRHQEGGERVRDRSRRRAGSGLITPPRPRIRSSQPVKPTCAPPRLTPSGTLPATATPALEPPFGKATKRNCNEP